jgi:membrane associated rhomboid family serine protease
MLRPAPPFRVRSAKDVTMSIATTIPSNNPIASRASIQSWNSIITARKWTFAMAIAAALLHLLDIDSGWLQLSRASLQQGHLWTIVTGPLLHVSSAHVIFDVLGLLIVGWFVEPLLRSAFVPVSMAINVAVALGVFAIYPGIQVYCGLSALDQGLLAAGAITLALRREWRSAGIIAIVLAMKWTGELVVSDSLLGFFASSGADPMKYGQPVPWCHAIGGVAGALSVLILRSRNVEQAVPAMNTRRCLTATDTSP